MSHSRPTYPWQQPYLEAVQETDNSKMPHHLLEATAAIQQRLLSPIDENSAEYRAILATRLGIEVLLNERCNSDDAHQDGTGESNAPNSIVNTLLRRRSEPDSEGGR
jgi:hypothetical protein